MDYQQPSFYRFSEDSIWLARAAREVAPASCKSLLDIGCGCGVVGIELSNGLPNLETIALVEKQKEFLAFIKENLKLAHRQDIFEIVQSDFLQWKDERLFDLVVSNPPYFKEGHGRASPDTNTQACRFFEGIELSEFYEAARAKLAPGGMGLMLIRTDNPDFKKISGHRIIKRRGDVAIISFQ